MKRHRLEDGIPKEEEEKPRKRMLQQEMLRRNSCFEASAEMSDFLICFSDACDHIMHFCALRQYDIKTPEDVHSLRNIDPMIIRPLTVFEREAVKSFYLALSPEDRRKRFCCSLSDDTISGYVDRLNFSRDTILGAFDEQAQIVGLAELAHGPKASEMAFSVRPDKRGQKIGTMLMQRLLSRAMMCGARKVFVIFLSDNTPMRRMAGRVGMDISSIDGEAQAERNLPSPSADQLARWYLEENLAHNGYFGTLGIARWNLLVNRTVDGEVRPDRVPAATT